MEPTLYDGDVVLVRKSNFVFWKSCSSYFKHYFPSSSKTLSTYPSKNKMKQDEEDYEEKDEIEKDMDMERIIKEIDASVGKYPSFFLDASNPLPGDVVIFQSPNEFPRFYHVKRVIGLGGQRVCINLWL